MLAAMETGEPTSYESLEPGTPVYSSDGEQIGTVAHVLAVEEEDVFDGIVIAERDEPARHEHRFVDADYVDRLYEHAAILKLDAAACRDLPRPTANPAVMRDDPSEGPPSRVHAKLQRAWDLLSGNY
jgi:PRC-barrel domain